MRSVIDYLARWLFLNTGLRPWLFHYLANTSGPKEHAMIRIALKVAIALY